MNMCVCAFPWPIFGLTCQELGAIFAPHKVCSSRILRDIAGNGRGVGFARYVKRLVKCVADAVQIRDA